MLQAAAQSGRRARNNPPSMSATLTIFALSSGAPPAGIGVIRVSGPQAGAALAALAGRVPQPRRATLAKLRDHAGALLDEALVLWFPGPDTATGEDLAELHCHGGRAVIAAVEGTLAALPKSKVNVTNPMCLAWHSKGQCNSRCPCAYDHIQYSAPELAPLASWCAIGYAPPPTPLTST